MSQFKVLTTYAPNRLADVCNNCWVGNPHPAFLSENIPVASGGECRYGSECGETASWEYDAFRRRQRFVCIAQFPDNKQDSTTGRFQLRRLVAAVR